MFNELFSNLHWLAILAGAAAFWLLGAIWYSPLLFAKPWSKLVNLKMDDPDAKKGMPLVFAGSFVLMFVSSIGLGVLLQVIPVTDALHAAKLGLLTSVCFSLSTISISYLYTRKPLSLYAIDGGYYILGTILAAVVIKWLS